MRIRPSNEVQRVFLSALLATLVTLGASSGARAAGVSDADLRGYKGGLVELTLQDGVTVRAMLYGYTADQLELGVAQDRTVMLHRSWVRSLKAAPTGTTASGVGAFPRNGATAYRPEAPPVRQAPRQAPREVSTDAPDSRPTPSESASTTSAPPPAAGTSGVPGLATGLVFQLRLGGNLLAIMGGGIASWLNASFLFGYKLRKLTIGLGLEMTYSDDSQPNADPDPIETSAAMVLFQPTLEYILAAKGPLALYGSVGLHLGFLNTHMDPGKDVSDPMIGFHAGLGMRYFFHPRFAMGVEGGVRGVWLMLDNDPSTNQDDENTGVMSLYGAATLTAIW